MSDAVRVAVRVRPFNQREKDRKANVIIEMPENNPGMVRITNPKETNVPPKDFKFDFAYWSHDNSRKNHGQQDLFDDLGTDILTQAFNGYNTTIFAYGQTGSGKSYSIMGYGEDKGIIPLAVRDLFVRLDKLRAKPIDEEGNEMTYTVEVAYLEIYNEIVRDLFNPANNKQGGLKIREDVKKGIYVENLSRLQVSSADEIERLIDTGAKNRTVAATAMNATSSRSHSVFTIYFKQTKLNKGTLQASDIESKINLVDLAGSERAASTGALSAGADSSTFKEGCAINKSLSALGNVISALADKAKNPKAKMVVPYRDSSLTRLLQESLGGNSKTAMVAALSPADINYEETLSTLRYADRAKKIKNSAKKNESPNAKLIRELKEEIQRLRAELAARNGTGAPAPVAGDATAESVDPAIMAKLEDSWREKMEAKMREELAKEQERNKALMGGASVNIKQPHLVNLHEDPMMNETLVYSLTDKDTIVFGKKDAADPPDIPLQGVGIVHRHCAFHSEKIGGDGDDEVWEVTLTPAQGAEVHRNGDRMSDPATLAMGDRIIIGKNYTFKFIDPKRLKELQEEAAAQGLVYQPPPIDFRMAHKEFGDKQMASKGMTQVDPVEAAAMDEKIKELEERIKLQQAEAEARLKEQEDLLKKTAKGTTDAQAAFRQATFKAQQEEMKQKMAEMERELESQRQSAVKKAEARNILEDLLGRALPLIDEANVISEELDRGMTFEVELRQDVHGKDDQTQVMVAATDPDIDRRALWEFDDFEERLYVMRELFNNYQEVGEDALKDLPLDQDPFYDENRAELIGSAQLLLELTSYGIPSELKTPIVDSTSKERGILELGVYPVTEDGVEGEIDDDDWCEPGTVARLKVKVVKVMGLPHNLCKNVHVKYHWFIEDPVTSEKCPVVTTNPAINHEHTFIADPVTPEFLNFLKEDVLIVDVYGEQTKEARPMTTAQDQRRNSIMPGNPAFISRRHSMIPPPRDGAPPALFETDATTGMSLAIPEDGELSATSADSGSGSPGMFPTKLAPTGHSRRTSMLGIVMENGSIQNYVDSDKEIAKDVVIDGVKYDKVEYLIENGREVEVRYVVQKQSSGACAIL
ncbi:Kinesin protein 1B [Carpediemonas membranifera]|uniref:Kinesin protein 1B n=1 Tax=Carpediemonas membranifera TaxID=201153 RepID=A0A8J6BUP8_9EUKA|nr:Kinesin protein 1B [Carpediemonas membranifera]|eukprot:KAG9390576.1 Kinesin protein 1B [Carpediemonas membranifera]